MAVKIITGDLLDAFDCGEVSVIGHCANMQNTFGSGIAKSIRERYPRAYAADCEWYKSPKHVRGPLSHAAGVFNLYGQVNYGREKRQLNYALLAKALDYMRLIVPEYNVVGFPYLIGCDRAGGDWEIVMEFIEEYFKNHTVKIYRLEKPI